VLLAELGVTELASDSIAAKYYANALLTFQRDTAMAAQPEPLLSSQAMGYRWNGERERCVRLMRRRREIVILHVYEAAGIHDPSSKAQALAARVVRRLS